MEYIVKAIRVIKEYIAKREKEGKKVLLFSLVAGHGMILNNHQVLLCNRLDL